MPGLGCERERGTERAPLLAINHAGPASDPIWRLIIMPTTGDR